MNASDRQHSSRQQSEEDGPNEIYSDGAAGRIIEDFDNSEVDQEHNSQNMDSGKQIGSNSESGDSSILEVTVTRERTLNQRRQSYQSEKGTATKNLTIEIDDYDSHLSEGSRNSQDYGQGRGVFYRRSNS